MSMKHDGMYKHSDYHITHKHLVRTWTGSKIDADLLKDEILEHPIITNNKMKSSLRLGMEGLWILLDKGSKLYLLIIILIESDGFHHKLFINWENAFSAYNHAMTTSSDSKYDKFKKIKQDFIDILNAKIDELDDSSSDSAAVVWP